MLFWFLERLFVIAALLYFSGGVLPLFRGNAALLPDRTEIDPLAFFVQLFFYSTTLLLILRSWRTFVSAALRAKWLLLLLIFAGASVAWSDSPALSARHAISLAATTCFAIYLGCSRTRQQQVRIMVCAFALAALLSLIFVLGLPQYGLEVSPGRGSDWRGIYFHKNLLGRTMLLGFVSALTFTARAWRNLLRYALLAVFLAVIFMSRSRTCLLLAGILVLVLPLLRLLTRRTNDGLTVAAMAGLIAIPALYWVATDPTSAAALIGRDRTLTGRMPLWSMVTAAIRERPWIGYGYDAFWLGMRGESGHVVNSVNFVPAHAHNGFLEVTLQLGAVGLALFAVGYFVACRKAFIAARGSAIGESLWPLMLLICLGIYNLAESALLKYTDIFWVMYTAAVVSRGWDEIVPETAIEVIPSPSRGLDASDEELMPSPLPVRGVTADADQVMRHA